MRNLRMQHRSKPGQWRQQHFWGHVTADQFFFKTKKYSSKQTQKCARRMTAHAGKYRNKTTTKNGITNLVIATPIKEGLTPNKSASHRKNYLQQ